MRYRTLGGTGIEVSTHCLGTMMFQAGFNPDHDDCARIIHAALDHGINFVDTADMYGQGESEEIVGKALRGRRDDVVLATKVHFAMGEGPNRGGNSRRWILKAVEDSLRRLDTEWIDLYQVHFPDHTTDIEETLSVLGDLVRDGKIRAFGCSNFQADEIVEAHHVSERRALGRFRTAQPPPRRTRGGLNDRARATRLSQCPARTTAPGPPWTPLSAACGPGAVVRAVRTRASAGAGRPGEDQAFLVSQKIRSTSAIRSRAF